MTVPRLNQHSRAQGMRWALLLVLLLFALAVIGPAHMAFHGDSLEDNCSACHVASSVYDYELVFVDTEDDSKGLEEVWRSERVEAPRLGQAAPRAPPLA